MCQCFSHFFKRFFASFRTGQISHKQQKGYFSPALAFWIKKSEKSKIRNSGTGELGYDRLNGTRKVGLSYAKSAVYI